MTKTATSQKKDPWGKNFIKAMKKLFENAESHKTCHACEACARNTSHVTTNHDQRIPDSSNKISVITLFN